MEADAGEAAVGTPSLTLVLAPSPPPSPPVAANADAPDAVGVKTETLPIISESSSACSSFQMASAREEWASSSPISSM